MSTGLTIHWLYLLQKCEAPKKECPEYETQLYLWDRSEHLGIMKYPFMAMILRFNLIQSDYRVLPIDEI